MIEHKTFTFLILFVALCKGGFEATGSFFQKYKSDGINVGSREFPLINSEFFRCGRSKDCVYVGRKGRKFSSVPEQRDDFMKDFDEVWKKTEIQTTSNSLARSF